jgi:hypothetical protein
MNNKKGQGALEYLLIIGAAVIIVVIAIVVISGIVSDTSDRNVNDDYQSQIQKLTDLKKDGSIQKKDSTLLITLFSINDFSAVPNGNNIEIILPSETDISSLTPEILYKGETISPSIGSTLDFSNPVEYTITDENGNSKKYTVTITLSAIGSNSDKNVSNYYFEYPPLETNFFSEGSNKIISLTFSYDTPKIMEFEIIIPETAVFSIAAATGEGITEPVEEIFELEDGNKAKYVYLTRDFSNNIEFTITAADGSKQKYIIRPNFLLNSENFIQTFTISSPVSIGKIDNDENTIIVSIPAGLGTEIFSPKLILSKDAVSNPVSETIQNFSNPVQYTITAQNGYIRRYTVSVIEQLEEYSKISSCSQLQGMTLTGNYILETNIDCSSVSNFVPIGTRDNPFSGKFEGNGKEIMNLSINSLDYYTASGLFGGLSGDVQNVGIINANVYGTSSVGVLAGEQQSGTIFNSYVTGKINSSMGCAGGLVGNQDLEGTISNCYADVNVTTSFWFIGGLVGTQRGLVAESYSRGIIVGERYTGVLTYTPHGVIIDSYWDIQTSLQSGGGGEGKTTAEMKNPSTFNSWDSSIWEITQGSYPKLVLFNENPI